MKVSVFSTAMRYFVVVAEVGSVNRAAERLCVAASAVSRQVSMLEDQLGVQLLIRHRQRMQLTAAGERLMHHLQVSGREADRVLEAVRGLGADAARRVRLACTEGFAASYLPDVLARFRTSHPELLLDVAVVAPQQVSALLLAGQADLGLKYAVAPEPGLRLVFNTQAPVLAAMRPAHPLAERSQVSVQEVVCYPLVLGGSSMTVRQLFDQACAMAGVNHSAVISSNSSALMLGLLQSHDVVLTGALTIAPMLRRRQLVVVPFEPGPLWQRRLQLLAPEGASATPMVEALTRALIRSIEQAHAGVHSADRGTM